MLRRCAGRPAAMIYLSRAMLSLSIDGWEFEALYIFTIDAWSAYGKNKANDASAIGLSRMHCKSKAGISISILGFTQP
jgi:hypothetical protein